MASSFSGFFANLEHRRLHAFWQCKAHSASIEKEFWRKSGIFANGIGAFMECITRSYVFSVVLSPEAWNEAGARKETSASEGSGPPEEAA